MAKRHPATMDDVKQFKQFKKLRVPLKSINAQDRIEIEESEVGDPGEDYSALYVNDKKVGHWAGY